MTNTVRISCIVNTTKPTALLGFEAWVDDVKFVDIDHVSDQQEIMLEVADAEAEHNLRFVLKNKQATDTRINEAGDIISDASLTLSDISIDDVRLGHMFTELATYQHNYNGTDGIVYDKFYGELGCNGTVSLKFTTPVYLWLLEHM